MISLLKIARWRKQENTVVFRESCPFCQREARVTLTKQFAEVDKKACRNHFAGYEWRPERGVIEFRFQNSL